jgi:hypothetical protein
MISKTQKWQVITSIQISDVPSPLPPTPPTSHLGFREQDCAVRDPYSPPAPQNRCGDITPSAGFHKNVCRLRRVYVSLPEVVMESKERRLECPGCKELMPALLLNDLNRCDDCGCHARFFKFCPPFGRPRRRLKQ